MAIQCGIVGLPNVGKSTLFNALTRAQIAAENYPFCTIDPNVGVVPVPDARLGATGAIAKPEKIVPTAVEFVDIAGLVAGASQGEGLGNQFLAHIREVDAIAHVVRCFENDDIVHVAGRIDPLSDSISSIPNWRWPIWRRSRRRWIAPIKAGKSGATRRRCAARHCSSACERCSNQGKPARAAHAERGAATRPARAAPADRQAGHVHRQRR